MAFTHQIEQTWQDGLTPRLVKFTEVNNGDAQESLDIPVPTSGGPHEVVQTIDVSQIQSFYMACDQAVTVEFNSGGTQGTIVLVADVPYIFTVNSYFANLITGDVTSLFIDNASGVIGNFVMELLYDSTL